MKRSSQAKPVIRRPQGLPRKKPDQPKAVAAMAGNLLLVHTLANLAALWLIRSRPDLLPFLTERTAQAWVWRTLIMQGAFILLPSLIVLLTGSLSGQAVTGSRAAPGSLFLSLAIGIPAAVVFQGVNNLLLFLLARSGLPLPAASESDWFHNLQLFSLPPFTVLLVVLVAALIPAVVEELAFRGIVFSALRATGARRSAYIWQALAFALFHADPLFILPPFLSGLLLAFVRDRCGRLWPAVLTHFSLNMTLIALAPLLPRLTQSMMLEAQVRTPSLLYASLVAACIAAVALIPLLVWASQLKRPGRTEPARGLFFPGSWTFALAIALQIVTIWLTSRP